MKKRCLVLGIIVFLCSVLWGAVGIVAQAKDDAFAIEAQVLPIDEPVYCVQLTIENLGEDWEGTVRLMVDSGYGVLANCVYDTALSLPQGSTKQFEVRLPQEGIDRTDGYVVVRLLDSKGNKRAEKNFPKLLQSSADAVPLGILSDAYASLTYLDMGGDEIYFGNRNRPMKLMQLRQDNLRSSLDTLAFLVIDSYDTKVLADEDIAELENWVDNGGILIVGTGDNAEKTLGSLDFLGIQYGEASVTKEEMFNWQYYIDTSQLSFVGLEGMKHPFDTRELGLAASWGDGAVMVLPCALVELGKLGTDAYDKDYETTQEKLIGQIYEDVSVLSESRYQWGNQAYESDYNLQRIFPSLGRGSNQLKFGGLKAIVILYVIFVGPVLYLILRALKKRDFYWIGVPVTTLIGIFLIYWAGRGFVVASTNVYSVTVQNLSANEDAITYLRCYDAGHKEWRLQMAEGYKYAGPLMNSYRYYSDDAEEGNYYHRIYKEGERLSIGLNPKVGFEDGFFLAGAKKGAVSGADTISWDGDKTITNETQWDFPYVAVIMNDHLLIYKNLLAGQSLNVEESACEFIDSVDTAVGSYGRYSSTYTPGEAYFYGYLRDSLREKEKVDIDLKAALGMGVSAAFSSQAGTDKVWIIGVAEDWDKAVDDDCNEVSYGCVYTVVEDNVKTFSKPAKDAD